MNWFIYQQNKCESSTCDKHSCLPLLPLLCCLNIFIITMQMRPTPFMRGQKFSFLTKFLGLVDFSGLCGMKMNQKQNSSLLLTYLIFVIFSPPIQFLAQFFSTQKRVNRDKTDFATKQRESPQNRFCKKKQVKFQISSHLSCEEI